MTFEAPDRACALCRGDEDCAALCEQHTESEQRLAHALAAVCQPEDTDETARWFIEDAAVIAGTATERDGWVVTLVNDQRFQVFTVNGVSFWVDPNEEGPGIPRPCTCTPDSCDAEGDPGCYVCQVIDGEEPCPAERAGSESKRGER